MLRLLVAAIIMFSTHPSYAAEDPAWSSDKAKLEKLVAEEKCEEYWGLLWPWAKRGNMEARSLLFLMSAMQLHMPEVYPPGRSGDMVSHLRDIIILGLHSLPYQNVDVGTDTEKVSIDILTKFISYYATNLKWDHRNKASKFMECWSKEKTQTCTKLAVNNGVIPSWEVYASEIDALIDNGLKSTCIQHTPPKAKY